MSDVMEATDTAVRSRVTALDGIRGVAIILVVISHGWALWDMGPILDTPLLAELFTSGNFAVSVFLVVGGYLAMRGLLGYVDNQGRPGPRTMIRQVLRRAVRTGAHTYTLLAIVMFVAVLDSSETYPEAMTRESVWRIATFTYNWEVIDRALLAREDLGHLWYVCVDLQVFLLLVVLVRFLGLRRIALFAALAGLIVLNAWWRTYVVDHEGGIIATLRTTTRMDGLLWGAALATAMPWIAGLRRYAVPLMWGSLGLLLLMLFTTGNGDDYFRQNGVLINVGLVGFLLAAALAPEAAPARALGIRPLAYLGRMSLAIYIWHYPIFFAVARWDVVHDWGWHWLPKTLLAFAITAGFAYGAQRLVEEPLQRWLARGRT